MRRTYLLFIILASAFWLTACASEPTTSKETAAPETEMPTEERATTASATEAPASITEETEIEETTKTVAPKNTTAPKARKTAPKKPAPRPKAPAKPAPISTSTPTAPVTPGPALGAPPKQVAIPPKGTAATAPPPRPKTTAPKAAPKPPKKPVLSHDAWDGLLRKYVTSSGKVNYAGIKSNKQTLESYLQTLAENPPQSSWSRNKTIAYWINAYNAFTVKLIVDNYPVSSIMDLDGGNPWKKQWIKIGGKTYSLNGIEKDLLLKQYKEPRVHFAVNCAAKSCPPLLNRAWKESTLEADFERQTKKFINNATYNSISENSAQLSKIFEWYAGDFGDVKAFVNRYSETKIGGKAKLGYKEYDWGLNR